MSETSTTCHLILMIRSTDLPLTTLYISAYSLLGSITRHPQCLIAECQQILPVRCCSDSCNHYRNTHRYTQVQQAGNDIFKHFGSLYPYSRGGWGHRLQLELMLVCTLWAQYPRRSIHRQTNHDQLVPPSPDWQYGFGTTVWFDTWHAKHAVWRNRQWEEAFLLFWQWWLPARSTVHQVYWYLCLSSRQTTAERVTYAWFLQLPKATSSW